MSTSAFLRRAAALAGTALLAQCGSALAPPSFPTGASALNVPPSGGVHAPGPTHPDRSRSWLLAPARCGYDKVLPPCGLLYVSDYEDDDVVVIQRDKVVGTLTGFDGPDGVCADHSGNVWITNNLGGNIVEYARGGTKPIKTLDDSGNYPLGCAVNPTSGALVVTNIFTTASGPGSVAIYHHASGPPLVLSDPNIYYVYFCGFDPAGDLFIDGSDTSGKFHFAELPRHRYKFKEITLNETIYYPGGIQWDGKYVNVGDQLYQNSEESAIYRTDGAGGKVVGTTVLLGAQDVVGYWIRYGSVIGPDANLNDVGLYRYPAGGRAQVRVRRLAEPYGAAVSL